MEENRLSKNSKRQITERSDEYRVVNKDYSPYMCNAIVQSMAHRRTENNKIAVFLSEQSVIQYPNQFATENSITV
ncbi:unnamed protein product [Acanthoscelides obtectus]|uniref:Uncharacterized protein n=1 Tax=Acanthoscelides obtectus TaxID=200917 RepID=A0A9P0LFG8_ACAOB|nr:unnamed protein product [Acanthoscelides obtectus]CAK1663164.1 hypothetical protein AOBTE_LOCUS23525 [Acanthoscelides obtectus]